jgi:hypothetical protein
MRDAVFFPVSGDAEIEIWITQFGCSADGTFMQRLGCAA